MSNPAHRPAGSPIGIGLRPELDGTTAFLSSGMLWPKEETVKFMVEVLKAVKRVGGVRTYLAADPAHEAFALGC